MTRMNPLRRLAASAAILGVTAFGGVALAAPASAAPLTPTGAVATADEPVGTVALPSLDSMTLGDLLGGLRGADGMQQLSPLPEGPVVVKIGPFKLTFQPDAAQNVQNVIANFYEDLGYQVAFNQKGVLVIGQKICDPAKSDKWNKGCVVPDTTSRF